MGLHPRENGLKSHPRTAEDILGNVRRPHPTSP